MTLQYSLLVLLKSSNDAKSETDLSRDCPNAKAFNSTIVPNDSADAPDKLAIAPNSAAVADNWELFLNSQLMIVLTCFFSITTKKEKALEAAVISTEMMLHYLPIIPKSCRACFAPITKSEKTLTNNPAAKAIALPLENILAKSSSFFVLNYLTCQEAGNNMLVKSSLFYQHLLLLI